jgi:hypothetical protein
VHCRKIGIYCSAFMAADRDSSAWLVTHQDVAGGVYYISSAYMLGSARRAFQHGGLLKLIICDGTFCKKLVDMMVDMVCTEFLLKLFWYF